MSSSEKKLFVVGDRYKSSDGFSGKVITFERFVSGKQRIFVQARSRVKRGRKIEGDRRWFIIKGSKTLRRQVVDGVRKHLAESRGVRVRRRLLKTRRRLPSVRRRLPKARRRLPSDLK